MANYNDLKAGIDAVIKTNGRQEISGAALNAQLKNMITELGAGYQYMGVATPATNPGTPDANVFYLASETGTYTNFRGIVINEGEVCALVWNGTWTKEVTGIATTDQLNQLGQKVDENASKLNGLRIEPVYYFNQLFNKDFVGNPSGENWEYGGGGYLIDSSGKIVAESTSWFTSNLIHWNGKNKAFCSSVRSIVQYDNQMNIVSVYYPSSVVAAYYLTRANNATYFKISCLAGNKSNIYVNYDDIIGNETYREFRYNVIECFEQLESYVLSESFRPINLTWSEGLPNTPVNVVYPSGYEGQITFVRIVATGLINSITATMNIQGDVLTSTFSITRNADGNVTRIITTRTIN